MNVQRMRSSCERWPAGRASSVDRRGSLVSWSMKPREYTMANGHRVLQNKGKVLLRGEIR